MRQSNYLRTLLPALLLSSWAALAQPSLTLSNTASAGGNLSLSLSLSGSASVAGLQWTLAVPSSVTSLSVMPGAALTSAGKTVSCGASAGNYTCIATGSNTNMIASGVIANISGTVSGSTAAAITTGGAMAVATDGTFASISIGSGTVILPALTVGSTTCSPTSLAPAASTICTVTLSSAARFGGATVTVGTTGSISATTQLTIAAGSTSGTFSATAGQFTTSQSASVTASINGISQSASLSLVAPVTPVTVTGLQCGSSTLASNASTTCTVAINQAAPAGGTPVTITGGIANVLTVPGTVTVGAGSTSATFTAAAGSLTTSQTVTLGAGSQTFNISLVGPTTVTVAALQCATSSLVPAISTVCTVTLSQAAPIGGSAVTITGGIPNALTVPASVTVLAGATTGTFTATAGSVTTNQTATLTAALNGSSKSYSITVVAPVLVSSFQCGSSSLTPNASTTCTITLNQPATSGGVIVTILGGIANVLAVPALVTVPAGATTATFTASTGAFSTGQTTTITAVLNWYSQQFTLSLVASTTPMTVTGLQCGSSSLTSNVSTSCTVTMNQAAPAGGTPVMITGGIANVLAVPAAVTVAAGSTTATFTITAGSLATSQTATLGAGSQTFNISLVAATTVTSLQCSSSSLVSNVSTTCSVTMNQAAPAGGALVTITGGIANVLTVPATVTVTGGSTSAIFTATAGSLVVSQTAVLGAGGQTFSISLVAPMIVTGLQCGSSSLASNASTTCTVTINQAAPAGGTPVTITGGITNVLTVPASVTVAAGSTTAAFTATAGTLTTNQTVTLGAGSQNFNISLVAPAGTPTLNSLNCNPFAVSPNSTGTCTVGLVAAAPTAVAVTLTSNNAGLILPSQVTIAAGASSGTFGFTTTSTLSGWLSITATLGSSSMSLVLPIAPPSATASLSCPASAAAGGSVTCQLTLHSSHSNPRRLQVASSTESVRVPATLSVRAGLSSVRFRAIVDPTAEAGTATLSVDTGDGAVQSSIQLAPADGPVLNVPAIPSVKTGSHATFHVAARSADGLPVTLAVQQLPAWAAFDPQSGDLEWNPSTDDRGVHRITFSASTATGASSSAQVETYVGSGLPELNGLLNGAGDGATAACTPGSVATLTGRFLAATDVPASDHSGASLNLQGTEVWVNGARTPVLSASARRVEFLCPAAAVGTALGITVRNDAGSSKELQSTMLADAPGILTVDGSGKGQARAMVAGSSEYAAVANPHFPGSPAVAGDSLLFLATGIACDANSSNGSLQASIGRHLSPILSIQPSAAYAGICELTVSLPYGIAADTVPFWFDVVHFDGTVGRSNSVSIAVADGISQ